MSLPFPWPVDITTPVDLLVYLNEQTGHLFGVMTLFMVFMVIFLSLKPFGVAKAYASACWTTALVSYPFVVIGLVGLYVAALLTIMAFTSILLIKEQYEF